MEVVAQAVKAASEAGRRRRASSGSTQAWRTHGSFQVQQVADSVALGLRSYLEFWSNLSKSNLADLVLFVVMKARDLEIQLSSAESRSRKSQEKVGNMASSLSREPGFALLFETLEFVHRTFEVEFDVKKQLQAQKLEKALGASQDPGMMSMHKILKRLLNGEKFSLKLALVQATMQTGVDSPIPSLLLESPYMLSHVRSRLHNIWAGAEELYDSFLRHFLGILKAPRNKSVLIMLMSLLYVFGEMLVIWPPCSKEWPILETLRSQIKEIAWFWAKPFCFVADHILTKLEAELERPGIHLRMKLKQVVSEKSQYPVVVDDMDPSGGYLLAALQGVSPFQSMTSSRVTDLDVVENVLKLGVLYEPEFNQEELDRVLEQLDNQKASRLLQKLEQNMDKPQIVLPELGLQVGNATSASLGKLMGNKEGKFRKFRNFRHWIAVPESRLRFQSLANLLIRKEKMERTQSGLMCMGTNRSMHLLLQHGLLDKTFLFLVPACNGNDICSFLATKDFWFQKHVFVPFCSPLLTLPALEAPKRRKSSSTESPTVLGTQSPLQGRLELLSDFIQGAEQTVSVPVFTVECWERFDAADSEPSKIIPMICQVELGLGCAVNRHQPLQDSRLRGRSVSASSFSSTTSSISSSYSSPTISNSVSDQRDSTRLLGSAWDDAMTDKNFTRSGEGPGVTPEVLVSILGVNLDGTPQMRTKELPPSEYLSICLAHCPKYAPIGPEDPFIRVLPYQAQTHQANPFQWWFCASWISQQSSAISNLHELIRKRDKKRKELDSLAECLTEEYETVFARSVNITCTSKDTSEGFYISVDDQDYGPFRRIKVGPSEQQSIDIKHFVPLLD